MIDINPSITVGNIIEICTIAGGGALFLMRQSNTINNTVNNMSKSLLEIKEYIVQEIADVQNELKKLNDVVTHQAVMNQRILNLEQDVRDMREGRGFISEKVSGEFTRHGKLTR